MSQVILVTGGSSGIGLAIARLFAAEAASVFTTGRRQAELDRAVASIGGHIAAIRADSASLSDLDNACETIKSE